MDTEYFIFGFFVWLILIGVATHFDEKLNKKSDEK